MQARPSLAAGIDIGGTKTAIGIVDLEGQIVARTALSTEPEGGFERAVGRFALALHSLVSEVDVTVQNLVGIGIGCAGPVDPLRGLINNPYTLTGWDHCDIVSPLQ